MAQAPLKTLDFIRNAGRMKPPGVLRVTGSGFHFQLLSGYWVETSDDDGGAEGSQGGLGGVSCKKDQAGDLRQKCTNLGREQEENI